MTAFRVILILWFVAAIRPQSATADIDFEKDIQPILSAKCFHCHGPDTGSRKGDLRLDTPDGASHVVVAGKPDQSDLFLRITSQDDADRMPPPDSKLSLTAVEIARLKQWIEHGARWQQQWALRPLDQPPLPEIPDEWQLWVRNPIDRFVLEKQVAHHFIPSPEASRRTLIRRVTFDLTGLPPTPQEVAAFVADTSDTAFEQVVDRLLASPRYGERWARHWMDAVHYADSHGHDEDAIRENAWPYRDYLIDSFNTDKPYARFVQDQIAGDVLFPNDPSGLVALGMLAAGPWDESSQMGIQDGTVDKEIARYLDRDDMIATVMNNFVSLTVHCARCHHHKFDPISREDYYSLQAVFAGVDRVERPYDHDPAVAQQRHELLAEQARLDSGQVTAQELSTPAVQSRVQDWERNRPASEWRVVVPDSVTSQEGATATPQSDGSVLFDGLRPQTDVYTMTAGVEAGRVTGVRLEVLTDDSLFHNGPGRQENGNLHLSEFKLLASIGDGAPVPVELHKPVADFDQSGWTIAHAIDGNPGTAWGIYPKVGQSHQAVFELKQPLDIADHATLTFRIEQLHGGGHLIGRPRLAMTAADNPGRVATLALVPPEVESILGIDPAQRSPEQKSHLALFVMQRDNAAARAALPGQSRVYSVAADFPQKGNFVPAKTPRAVHVLNRGNVLDPVELATPGALSCLETLNPRFENLDPTDEGTRRAALANWVSSRDNVLTWRSIVNRIWQHHLGRGLVSTPNDFGRNGSPPTHPELLDWLAVWFRDGGGSLKQLHRLIVTSATYRQSTQHRDDFAATDQDNQFLWRMNRRRLDAESTRDAILQMSELADWTMGGPPARQFLLGKGVHVTPTAEYSAFDVDSPDARRRSVYRFIFRTVPDPFMEALDCPDASQFTPERTTSMTSLQALALWNNQFVVAYCEHIARRLEAESPDRPNQIRRLFLLALSREPTEDELKALGHFVDEYGLGNACRVVVNSNEFMFVD